MKEILKITIVLQVEANPNDEDEVKEAVHEALAEQMDEDALEFDVESDEDAGDEE